VSDKAREYLELWYGNADATEEIQLSLGPAVIRTAVSILDLVAAGHIPTPLLAELQKLSEVGNDPKKQLEAVGQLPAVTPALDAACLAAFVAPPLSREEEDGYFPLGRVPISDKLKVFFRLMRGVEPLREFHEEPRRANGAARAGDSLPLPAVGDSGNS
jgi:hypothetical protein